MEGERKVVELKDLEGRCRPIAVYGLIHSPRMSCLL
jgi:hypothetical protein